MATLSPPLDRGPDANLTLPDIVERFQLGIMLFVIALRNLMACRGGGRRDLEDEVAERDDEKHNAKLEAFDDICHPAQSDLFAGGDRPHERMSRGLA
jgi:hypothetical protein